MIDTDTCVFIRNNTTTAIDFEILPTDSHGVMSECMLTAPESGRYFIGGKLVELKKGEVFLIDDGDLILLDDGKEKK